MPRVSEPKVTKLKRRVGQLVGYLRVSTVDQKELRQLEGVKLDKKFVDYASGKDLQRPRLAQLLGYVREGDTVVCHSMDRLGRNLDDLRKVVLGMTAGHPRSIRQGESDVHGCRLTDGKPAAERHGSLRTVRA
jgi:hypothetical protein